MESFEKECNIRGYHVYKEIWEAAIGEELDCRREPSNAIDRYAVAVMKSGRCCPFTEETVTHLLTVHKEGRCDSMPCGNTDNGPEGSGRLPGLRCCVT